MAGFVAECFWPAVRESDLTALDERAQKRVAELSRRGEPVRYLGLIPVREDEQRQAATRASGVKPKEE